VPRAGRVLVVDDEVSARTTLADLLSDDGYEVEMAADAFKALGKCEAFAPHVVVTDLEMPGMGGLELVKRIRAGTKPPAVIVMTAFAAVSSAVEAMRAGAADYLTKPFDFDALLAVLDHTFELQQLQHEPHPPVRAAGLVGATPAMLRIFETIEQVAPSRATVLITGEAGTGKEAIATAIHRGSPRAQRSLIKLHCAGLSELQLEAELSGRLAQASGGTLFLDEVADIPPAIQIKLLRFLEDQAAGADVRVIAATRRELGEEVAAGRFREDLYYRLRVVAIAVPPLRERPSDIPALVKAFIHKHAYANHRLIEGLSQEALELLAPYRWPGNVRELETAIESAVVLAKGSVVDARALPPSIRAEPSADAPPRIPGSTLADIERHAIFATMQATGGSTSKAAEILGISTRTVQYRLHQYHEAQRSERDVIRKK
jgi:DNA-binding NtrC family response regulator